MILKKCLGGASIIDSSAETSSNLPISRRPAEEPSWYCSIRWVLWPSESAEEKTVVHGLASLPVSLDCEWKPIVLDSAGWQVKVLEHDWRPMALKKCLGGASIIGCTAVVVDAVGAPVTLEYV